MRLRLITGLWLSCLCAACAGSHVHPVYPIRDVGQLLERQRATSEGLTGMRAEARVDQRKGAGRVRGTVFMFVEQTGRVRFDVMTQFGPVAILTSDGQQFAYSDFRAHRYLSGETCPSNIARFLGLQLTAQDTARFLLGGTPLLSERASSDGGVARDVELNSDGHYRVQLTAADGARQTLELAVYESDVALAPAQQRLHLVRSELHNSAGEPVWRVRYEAFEPIRVGERSLLAPTRVQIEQPAQGSDTLVTFKKIVANPEIAADVFVQTPRAGLQEEDAPCE